MVLYQLLLCFQVLWPVLSMAVPAAYSTSQCPQEGPFPSASVCFALQSTVSSWKFAAEHLCSTGLPRSGEGCFVFAGFGHTLLNPTNSFAVSCKLAACHIHKEAP